MKSLRSILLSLSAFFSAGMLFFTFFTFAWHSDAKGFEWGWEIPVGFNSGLLSTVADFVWMAAPFFLLFASLFFFSGATGRRIGILLSCLPMTLYAVLRVPSFFEEKTHGTLLVTILGILLIGVFSAFSAFIPEAEKIAPIMVFSYLGIELLLLFLSALLQEKYSFFYFSQLLPMGHTSYFRYSFFAISPFCYYFFYALSLGLRMIPVKETIPSDVLTETNVKSADLPEKAKSEEEETDEDNEEDYSSLTLEDLGIER